MGNRDEPEMGDGERLLFVPTLKALSRVALPTKLLTSALLALLDSAVSGGSSDKGGIHPGELCGEPARLSGSSGYKS